MADERKLCVYCNEEVGTARKCILCQNFGHVFCDKPNERRGTANKSSAMIAQIKMSRLRKRMRKVFVKDMDI